MTTRWCKFVLSIPLQPQQAPSISRHDGLQRGRGRAGELPRSDLRQEKSCQGHGRKPSQRTRVNLRYRLQHRLYELRTISAFKVELRWLQSHLLRAFTSAFSLQPRRNQKEEEEKERYAF